MIEYGKIAQIIILAHIIQWPLNLIKNYLQNNAKPRNSEQLLVYQSLRYHKFRLRNTCWFSDKKLKEYFLTDKLCYPIHILIFLVWTHFSCSIGAQKQHNLNAIAIANTRVFAQISTWKLGNKIAQKVAGNQILSVS